MNVRRAVIGAITALAIASGIACGDDVAAPDAKTTKTKAPAVAAPPPPKQPKVDPTGQQPAPAADPGAHNTDPGMVGLFVSWESENKDTPLCEWSRNGARQPCAGMKAKRDPDGIGWYGFWEYEETASAGALYTVNAEGGAGVQYVTCEIAWKGRIHEGAVGDRQCGISYTLE